MLADLHVHSMYSDGWYTPDEVCRRAKERGLGLLAITDHDTLDGEEEKRAAAKKYGLLYTTGWEISAYEDMEKLHILGYGCRLDEPYYAFVKKGKAAALLRVEDSVKKLNEQGIALTVDEALSERATQELAPHTMHVARALGKRLGISEAEAYASYLAVGNYAYSSIGRPTPKEAIACIHALGGVAVIAHPGRLAAKREEREKILQRLVELGADGIERTYTTHTNEETAYFMQFARERGLLETGGSDTHIEDATHRIGSPSFTPSEAFLEKIGIAGTR